MIAARRFRPPPGATLAFVLFVAATASAADEPVVTADTLTDSHVRAAIHAIVDELYARKHPVRFWEPAKVPSGESKTQGGGYTALVALALLHAGESYQDPRLADAIEHLRKTDFEGTYATAVRTILWSRLSDRFEPQLAGDVKWLIDGFSETAGGWTYTQVPNTIVRDNSITQFGALALWEAARRGATIEERYWRRLEQRFLEMQLGDGGWNYQGREPARGSMTAAGLATLFITQDRLHAAEAKTLDRTPGPEVAAIGRALDWMDANFSATENPGLDVYYFYYMFSVERAGLASGHKHFGRHDWFREGAAEMINRLCVFAEDGSAQVNAKMYGRGNASIIRDRHLAFALMFLSRGRVPVAFNKLSDPWAAWNNRPRDVANLTDWIRASIEREVNWQIVAIQSEPEAWLDAPLLYVASHRPVSWFEWSTDLDRAVQTAERFHDAMASGEVMVDAPAPDVPVTPLLEKVRRYLDLGGMIFAVNEGNGTSFAESVRRAGRIMYPQYRWRKLPDDHPAYTMLWPVRGRRPVLEGLTNGVRELIVLAPATDFAEAFQLRDDRQETLFQVAANIWLYAAEEDAARPRIARHVVQSRGAGGAIEPVTVVHAMHRGNWNAEPGALEVFRRVAASEHGLDVRVWSHPLHAIDQLDPAPVLVLASGTRSHEFTAAERSAIEAYVRGGGTILFESTGGNGAFTASAESVARELFGAPVRSVLRDPIVTGDGIDKATSVRRVEYRPYALREVFAARETRCRLRAVRVDGMPRVLFSREDILHGVLDQPCWGIAGYSAQDARRLLANIIHAAAR